jgi:hypothetical protein
MTKSDVHDTFLRHYLGLLSFYVFRLHLDYS